MTEGPDELPCPECERSLDPRGYQPHLRKTHGYSPERARVKFEAEKSDDDTPGRPLAGGAGETPEPEPGHGPVAGPAPAVETSVDPADDPELAELDKEIEKTRRLAELERLQGVLESDDGGGGDDALETIAKLREAGLIGDDGDDEALRRELQALKSEMQTVRREAARNGGERGGRAADGGAAASRPMSIDGDADPLTAALAAGVEQPDVIGSLAEASPEVKKAELEFQKEAARWERREQLVERVLDGLSDPDALSSLASVAGAVFGGDDGAADGLSPNGEQAAEDDDGAADVTDDGGEPASPARERHAEVVAAADADADDADAAAVGEFRGPDGGGDE